jgi:multidrug transporter EmrE-like cation transporter
MKTFPLSQCLLWAALPLFNTLNQIAMKLSAQTLAHTAFGWPWLREAASCPTIWMALVCEVINFAVWLAILKRHTLAQAFPLTAIGYAALMLVSWGVFHEPMAFRQIAGTVIIMTGIAVMGFKSEA